MKIAALLPLIVLLTAAVRVPCIDYPFERDEGECAYIAWRLGHDELPYRDWVDQDCFPRSAWPPRCVLKGFRGLQSRLSAAEMSLRLALSAHCSR
jgi:hypothetical protein